MNNFVTDDDRKKPFLVQGATGTYCIMYVYTYNVSVSAGREFWPFRVIFFQKVEPSCDQT